MYKDGTCKLQTDKSTVNTSNKRMGRKQYTLEDDDQMAFRANGIRALAVDGEIIITPKYLGAVVRWAAEALYAWQGRTRRLRGEERRRVGCAMECFRDDAAHGAAAPRCKSHYDDFSRTG